MSDGIPYADILIMALVAGFIILRLRSILGDKMGNDNPSYFNKPAQTAMDRKEPIVQIEDKSGKIKLRQDPDPYMVKVKDEAVIDGINAIKLKDPEFNATYFLEGAKGAYEMVFDAFSKGDKDTLKFLLSSRIFQEFSEALTAAEKEDNRNETTLISVKANDIISADISGITARVAVSIFSEQVQVTRNAAGDIIEGILRLFTPSTMNGRLNVM